MEWTFEQLEGPSSERKKIILSGWYAPFGRPRREPVIRELIRSRVQTTRYPGSRKQTRHAFGTNWEPTELKGRWMTKAGTEIANDMADTWTAFIQDERTCRISWGNIISWTGFIEELELGRESEHEIAWRMKVHLDERDDAPKRKAPRPFETRLDDGVRDCLQFLAASKLLQAPAVPDMSPDFLDSLDNLAAELNKPAALMNKIAGGFDDLEKKTFSTLQHFRGAVTGFRTAILTMQETVINAGVDTAILVRTVESDIAWVKYQTHYDEQAIVLLDMLNVLDRTAETQQRFEASKFITAVQGDTWESLSTRASGSPDKSADIRSINGARYGEQPVPGNSYLVQ